ncbi:MAG TPA: nuclear transport factor 2 family protein [Gemmatimonadales bacterium]|nr:nuclear transport factor 2 family protein [Gemmatimonadales bacterium]
MTALRISLALALAGCAHGAAPPVQPAPATAARELMAADRDFSRTSGGTDLVTGITRMFAPDVVMVAPSGIVRGAAEAEVALRSNPDNPRSRVTWIPIRGGVSADGEHGFTYGYMTMTRPDGSELPGKYVAYWRRTAEGWRVAAYKRAIRAAGPVTLDERAPAVPRAPASPNALESVRYTAELQQVEREFSRAAQNGFAAAFRKYAAPDAAHIGGGNDASFLFGPDAISRPLGDPAPPGVTTTWEAADALAAASGDLGVTIGSITTATTATDSTEARRDNRPYFTIWRRDSPAAPWRFVVE